MVWRFVGAPNLLQRYSSKQDRSQKAVLLVRGGAGLRLSGVAGEAEFLSVVDQLIVYYLDTFGSRRVGCLIWGSAAIERLFMNFVKILLRVANLRECD